MKVITNQYASSILVKLKDNNWLEKQRVAGRVVAETLLLLENQVRNKTTLSMIELNQLAEEHIYKNDCEATFKGYGNPMKPFPAGVCISISNDKSNALVHGVPTDYRLQEGDKVSFDLGATYKGVVADSALTLFYGQPKKPEYKKLLLACEEALMKAIAAVKVGKQLGVIGNAIHKCAKGYGYGNIEQYGGHGISITADGKPLPHAPPFVPNKANSNEGIRLQNGFVCAIEPMFTMGSTKTWVAPDGWTVLCAAEMSVHQEHTIFIHNDNVEIMTWRGNENYLKSNRIYFNKNTT